MSTIRSTFVVLLALCLLSACGTDDLTQSLPTAHGDEETRLPQPADASQAAFIEAHRFTVGNATITASNDAADMTAAFDATGVRMSGPQGQVTTVALDTWGRSSDPTAAAYAIPRPGACVLSTPDAACLEQLEFSRGDLLEWWRNGTSGLQQGFEVAIRPTGSGPLSFSVSVDADLTPTVVADAVLFARQGRTALTVHGLQAWDSDGDALTAWFEADSGTLRYMVDDAGADYPITVDPIFSFVDQVITPSTGDSWGSALAGADIDGDGRDDVAIGDPDFDGSGVSNVGRVDVFLGSASGLESTAVFTYEGLEAGAELGSAVVFGDFDSDGDIDLAAGAPRTNGQSTDDGATLVWLNTGSSPFFSGTPLYLPGTAGEAGLCGSPLASGDVNGDTFADLLVGCGEGHSATSTSDPGTVDVYLGGTTMPSSPSATLEGVANEEEFSHGLAVGDVNGDGYDDVLVGSEDDDTAASNAGVLRLYLGGPNGLATTATKEWFGTQISGEFGAHVASGGDVNGDGYDDALVATPDWTGGFTTEGKVELFYGSSLGLSDIPSASWFGGQGNASLGGPSGNIASDSGSGVAFADVNADGYDDILLAAWLYDAGGASSVGQTRVVLGGPAGPEPYDRWSGTGAAGSQEGYGLLGADVNGDAMVDLVLGAPLAGTTGTVRLVPAPLGNGISASAHEVGSLSSLFNSGSRIRGDIYLVSTASIVTEVQMYLNPTVAEPIEWGYYTSSTLSGTYTLQGSVTSTATTGAGWKSTGPIDVEVNVGDYVAFVAQWDSTASYWRSNESLPTALPGFGTVEASAAASGTTLPATGSLYSTTTNAYAQRLIVAPLADADGDGANAMEDCQDGAAANGPFSAEVCDGLDNDCDGGANFGIDTFESHTGTSISSNATNIKGNRYDVTSTVLLNSVDVYFRPDSAQPLNVGVWTRASGTTGNFALQRSMSVPTSGATASFWTADLPDLLLTPGTEVMVAYQWGGPSGGYSYQSSNGAAPSWGTYAGCMSGSANVPVFPGDDYAAPEIASGNYRIRLNTSLEFDADGDGDFACSDCDDTDPTSFNGATELCDGLDNDCDTAVTGEADGDADGYRECDNDCNDNDPNVNPGATEICDGVDTNCDGTPLAGEVDSDADGEFVCAGDCDDSDPGINTSASEVCDGADTNCDGSVIQQYTSPVGTSSSSASNYFRGGRYTMTSTVSLDGFAVEINPVAGTNLDFLVYEDTGGGLTLIAQETGTATGGRGYYYSPGFDGLPLQTGNDYVFGVHWTGGSASYYWASLGLLPVSTGWGSHVQGLAYTGATTPTGAQLNNGQAYHMIVVPSEAETDGDVDGFVACAECNDVNALTYPAAPEICDLEDNDCDGNLPSAEQDGDGDGFVACQECDDTDPTLFPGGTELCDGLDNDCDGTVPADELDGDADGVAPCGGDCDDNDSSSLPGGIEVCDGADNDCSGAPGLDFLTAEGSTTFSGIQVVGNQYAVTANTAVDMIAMDLDPPAGGFTGTWGIWDVTGTPFLVASTTDTYTDQGRAYYQSSSFGGVLLNAGNSYILSVDFNSTGVNYYFTTTSAFPIAADPIGTITSGAIGSTGGTPSSFNSRSWNMGIVGSPEVDGDIDSFLACGECDDAVPATFPGAPEACDGADNDCDGVVPANEIDGDGDGSATCDGDCNDADPTINSGATEICDGLDNDCNGTVPAIESDADGDGQLACGNDCNDNNATIFTGATELCDGWDNDCDGSLGALEVDADADNFYTCTYVTNGGRAGFGGSDCNDGDAAINPGATEICNGGINDDCDATTQEGTDVDGDGETSCTDCNDNDQYINSSATEFCDGRDSDCDGVIPTDEGDPDSDGYIECFPLGANANPPTSVQGAGDCGPTDNTTFPNATEVCDGIDNNCDGTIPANELDGDGDGLSACAGDCDDTDAGSLPGAAEVCDGVDNDCNGTVPANESDNDADGQRICAGDCNDANATIFNGAPELCDSLDNDCDGTVPADEIDGDGDSETLCEGDCDDTNGAIFTTASEVCDGLDNNCDGTVPTNESDADSDGALACAGDCNDNDATVAPGLAELCDGLDNDCNGTVPANESDNDSDSVRLCDGDCNDANATVFPTATELCDGLDNDCDGAVPVTETDDDGDGDNECADNDCDDADATSYVGAPELCDAIDNDCDGVVPGDETDDDGDGDTECDDGDCDDTESSTYLGAPELCDGVDNDCDGSSAGEGDADSDGDLACSDCDDADAANYTGNTEVCDGQDNDCNAVADADALGEVDGDSDGELSCIDCDDSDAANLVGGTEVCDGQDNDCDGDADFDTAGEVDGDSDGSLSCADCDDADAAAYPGNTELCDGVDNDCDGSANFGGGSEADADADGSFACEDCDDNDAANFPGNVEICDGIDNDCDGVVEQGQADADADGQNVCDGDCDDADPANFTGNAEVCDGQDNDCNTLSDFDAAGEVDADGDLSLSCADCDDTNAAILPGTPEVCDGLDTDCNGTADADAAGEVDADSDGSLSCDDCDDADAANTPGATELCDGQDNDCNGTADADAAGEVDADGDLALSCADCDDADNTVFPGGGELCDGLDNDCDGLANADEAGEVDVDLDGELSCDDCDDEDDANYYANTELCDGQDNDCNGDADFGGATDEVDGDGDLSFDCEDCDDADVTSYPGAPELCDGLDNDCDGTDPSTESEDQDGDTFSVCQGDCDDANIETYDGATEICDGLDNDCDGVLPTDEIDPDGDGYLGCLDDCDDLNPLVNPGADESANCDDGEDNDCDGDVDGDDADCQGGDDDDATGDDDDATGDDDDDSGADDDDATGDDDDTTEPDPSCECNSSLVGTGFTASWALVLLLMTALPLRRRR